MNYQSVLVGRWTRRDCLAVLIVALIAALLVGATLLIVAAGDQTTTLAADYDANETVTAYDSPAAADTAADADAIVLLTATAHTVDGETTRVVSVPNDSLSDGTLLPPSEGAVGPVATQEEWVLEGESETTPITVAPAGSSGVLPSSWIRVPPETFESLDPTGALVIERTDTAAPNDGSPLVGALAFFVTGTSQTVHLLWSSVIAAGIVVGVTISSVVRMTIQDRSQAIRVIRATGAPGRRVRLALAARAGLLTAVGATLGYAIGVVVANVAVNVAVFLGLPTTLSLRVTGDLAVVLLGALGALTLCGTVSGYTVARRSTSKPVAAVGTRPNPIGSGPWARLPATLRHRVRPTLLSPRTILPTTATLAAFAAIFLLVVSVGAVGTSLTAGGATVTEPGASHPVASQVPESYADAIGDRSITASPEIIIFGTHNGDPFLARGADYDAFAAVTAAQLVTGHAPTVRDEAVVGAAAAERLDLHPGDELTIGGSTEPALTQVTVVGIYETGALEDHQVLVSLETARHLSTVEEGNVNLIRTNASVLGDSDAPSPLVVGVDAPTHPKPDEPISVAVTLWNPAAESRNRQIPVQLGDSRLNRTVELAPRDRITIDVELPGMSEGEYVLRIGTVIQQLTVSESPPYELRRVPSAVPVGERFYVRVADGSGQPVSNATVALSSQIDETAYDGSVWLRAPNESGTYDIAVQNGEQETRTPIRITEEASRTLGARTTLEPSTPGIHVRPALTTTVWNPWNRPRETTITIDGPGTTHTERIALEPGTETTTTVMLPRRPPGWYTVHVAADGRSLTSHGYRVHGDERLTGALAASGHYGGGGGLGSAVEYAVGNLQVVLGSLVALAALTVVGATSAVLARAVHARRRTIGIYRATGASPRRVLALVVSDAVRIGTVSALLATVTAIIGLEVAAAAGRLTAFGITLDPRPSGLVVMATVAAGIVLTLIAAIVATIGLVRTSPHALFSASKSPPDSMAPGVRGGPPTGSTQDHVSDNVVEPAAVADEDADPSIAAADKPEGDDRSSTDDY